MRISPCFLASTAEVKQVLAQMASSLDTFTNNSHSSRLSSNESDSKMKKADNIAIKRSLASSGSSSNGRSSAKRSKTSTKDQSHLYGSKTEPRPLTLIELSQTKCNKCVLCSMPDCERCFACVANKHAQDEAGMKCCIRKVRYFYFSHLHLMLYVLISVLSQLADVLQHPDPVKRPTCC
jgi:hypothetical protein